MPLEAPELDDRKFDDLFREARQRIPRYAPQWTDWNDSDPGITLLQLYAWLTESIIYRLNQVPERNYVKFLQLLGEELEPAQPASAYLTFTARAGAEVDPVRRGSQVGAQSSAGELLIFETEEGLSVIPEPLASLQVFDGAAFQDVSAANQAEGAPFYPLGWRPQIGSALYLGFEKTELPAGMRSFPQELRFRVFLPAGNETARPVLSPPIPPEGAVRCGAPLPRPPVTLEWEYLPETGARWRRLGLYKDTSVAFTREGDVVVAGPTKIAAAVVGRVADERYWLRCRLTAGSYPQGRAPTIELLRPNTVSARNLATVREEALGESTGEPDQSFSLRHKPVQPGSLSLWVEPAVGTAEEWQRVDDLLGSEADAPDYVLNATAGNVLFGDRSHGRIPAAGASIIAREYRYGGGAAGNLAAGQIKTPLTSLQGVDKVENARATVGGRDKQSVDELKRRAPALLRHRYRAVTAEDYAALAVEAGGVLRAKAIPLAHPSHEGVEVPGAVTVVVVPDSDALPPEPSADLLSYVCGYLDGFRLLGAEVSVAGPTYLEIRVEARVTARPYAAFDAVQLDVEAALEKHLDPQKWEFGADLYPTRLYDKILDVADVVSVKISQIFVNGRPHVDLGDSIVVPEDGLVWGADHEITVTPAVDL